MTERKGVVSREAAELLAALVAEALDIPTRETLEQYRTSLRSGFEPYVQTALAGFEGDIDNIQVDGIPCLQLTAKDWSRTSGPVIQYAYGGGYISGSAYEDQAVAAPLAQKCGARVIMVEYRLSPEHPYPAPQEDMRRVYPALLENFGAARLVLSGESAGGNQALGLLHHIRELGLQMPCCAALFSPWCDLANQGDSHRVNHGRDPTMNNDWVDLAAAWHAAGHPLEDPGISPLHGDMRGLPPVIITSGSRDLLLSQCLRLAQKLRAAGVECDLRVWEGLWHVFEFYPIPEAEGSLAEVAAFIRAHC